MNEGGSLIKFKGLKLDLLSSTSGDDLLNMASLIDHCLARLTSYALSNPQTPCQNFLQLLSVLHQYLLRSAQRTKVG